jgi:hypothetical protein
VVPKLKAFPIALLLSAVSVGASIYPQQDKSASPDKLPEITVARPEWRVANPFFSIIFSTDVTPGRTVPHHQLTT